MKQPKDSETPGISAPEPSAVRYLQEAPLKVTLKLAELEWAIPQAARAPLFTSETEIDLPCPEIFASPVPKITCARLAELHPRFFIAAQLPEAEILLPPAPLALNYRLIERRAGPPAPAGAPAAAAPPVSSEKAPALEKTPAPSEKAEPAEPAASPSKFWPPKPKPTKAQTSDDPVPEPKRAAPASSPASPASPTPEPAKPAPPTTHVASPESPGSPTAKSPEVSRSFSFFGLFRRRSVAVSPEAETNRPTTEPEPKPAGEKSAEAAKDAPRKEAAKKNAPKPESKTASPVELVPVSAETSEALGNQEELQKIFLTTDQLTLKHVVALCGGLSGVRSCLLAQRSIIIASHQPPANLDLVSLSANALQMIDDMRRSAGKMGLGAIPAVTIHSEKGPVTFFPNQDLCLLILQDEKGLAPGVREKLEAAMAALGKAGLPRQIGN